MFKKVVAGGTFNKIHKGHEELVKKVNSETEGFASFFPIDFFTYQTSKKGDIYK